MNDQWVPVPPDLTPDPDEVREGLWAVLRRQPVRAWLYGVLVPAEAVAVSYGLAEDKAALWLALAAALLVVPATEVARRKVTPVVYPHDDQGRLLYPLVDDDEVGTRDGDVA